MRILNKLLIKMGADYHMYLGIAVEIAYVAGLLTVGFLICWLLQVIKV